MTHAPCYRRTTLAFLAPVAAGLLAGTACTSRSDLLKGYAPVASSDPVVAFLQSAGRHCFRPGTKQFEAALAGETLPVVGLKLEGVWSDDARELTLEGVAPHGGSVFMLKLVEAGAGDEPAHATLDANPAEAPEGGPDSPRATIENLAQELALMGPLRLRGLTCGTALLPPDARLFAKEPNPLDLEPYARPLFLALFDMKMAGAKLRSETHAEMKFRDARHTAASLVLRTRVEPAQALARLFQGGGNEASLVWAGTWEQGSVKPARLAVSFPALKMELSFLDFD